MINQAEHIYTNILIVGVNPVSLAIGEYLNRSNYYHDFIIIGGNYSPINTEEEYLLNTLPIIYGKMKTDQNKIYLDTEKNRFIFKWNLTILTGGKGRTILETMKLNPENVDSRLINKNKKCMISPLLVLRDTRATYETQRKTGHIMGVLLVKFLNKEKTRDAYIRKTPIPIYPKYINTLGEGAIWYINEKGYRHITINEAYTYELESGIGIILYRELRKVRGEVDIKIV